MAAGSWTRGRNRRGGTDADRPRPQGKGLLQGHPSQRAAGPLLHRADRAHRDRGRRGRGRDRGLRAAVRRADVQHRPATPGCRPGCRSRRRRRRSTASAARPSRRSTSPRALIAAGVHDVVIGSGVEHMGHMPMGVGFHWVEEVGSPWPPELMERYNLIPQGLSAEMIADQWEIPRSELDELARALTPARCACDRRRPVRTRDGADAGQRLDVRGRPGDPARHDDRGARRSSSRRSSPTARSPPATARRSPTAPPRCC